MIVIKAQEYRSQELNREAARQLVAVIKDLTTEQKPEDLRGPPVHRKSAGWHRKHKKSSVKAMRGKVQRSGNKKEGMDGEKKR